MADDPPLHSLGLGCCLWIGVAVFALALLGYVCFGGPPQ
jgi:hypothetical protein